MFDLKFSTNWNRKLFQNHFTTFRIYDQHRHRLNEICHVIPPENCDFMPPFDAYIQFVRITKLRDVDPMFCILDTGYAKDAFIAMVVQMYKNKQIDIFEQNFVILMLCRCVPLKLHMNIFSLPYSKTAVATTQKELL